MEPLFKRVELCRAVCVYVITSFFTIYHVYRFFGAKICAFSMEKSFGRQQRKQSRLNCKQLHSSQSSNAPCAVYAERCAPCNARRIKKCRFACVSSAFNKIRFCWNGKILIRTWQTSKRTYIQSDFHLHHRLLQADFIPKFTSFIPFQHTF